MVRKFKDGFKNKKKALDNVKFLWTKIDQSQDIIAQFLYPPCINFFFFSFIIRLSKFKIPFDYKNTKNVCYVKKKKNLFKYNLKNKKLFIRCFM